MSKNPAWAAYNESVRLANEEYEKSIKPLRNTLSTEIAQTERRFDDKINPLIIEKRTIITGLKDKYSDAVVEAETKRNAAIKTAAAVRQAEMNATKDKVAVA